MHKPDLRNLRELEVFVEVADRLSFTGAARSLLIAQPAVSRYVKNLETSLSASLFDRLGGRLVLTDSGRALYEYARKMLALAEEAESAMTSTGKTLSGVVRVGTDVSWEYLLADVIACFAIDHPEVVWRVQVGHRGEIPDLLLANQIGLGLVIEDPRDMRFDVERILEAESVIIAAPNHPLALLREVSPKQLERTPFVALGMTRTLILRQNYAELMGIDISCGFAMESIEGVKRIVSSGKAIGMLMSYVVKQEIESGQLVALKVSGPPRKKTLFAIRHKGGYLPPTYRAILDQISSHSQNGIVTVGSASKYSESSAVSRFLG